MPDSKQLRELQIVVKELCSVLLHADETAFDEAATELSIALRFLHKAQERGKVRAAAA